MHTQSCPEKASALSVIIAHSWALKVLANLKLGVNQFTKFRAASCHCFASCHCCHDPFIVRSAKLVHRSLVSLSFAHPSRSRSTLTIVCFCATSFPVLSSFGLCSCLWVYSPGTRSIIGSSPSSCSGVWDVASSPFRIGLRLTPNTLFSSSYCTLIH